ncbi:MAG TPA: HEAT repeat domain-containing protein, partial [Candidatus Elarobacter sp.]|nr:HEAT repeat domain-containing protein [Candidatus Elarobacter sp.]
FPGRADVCGDGQSFLSTGGGSSYYGRVTIVNGVASQPCTAGPVRVVVDRADGLVTNIETVAGPLHAAEGATDLGTVTGRDAAEYLMSVAATSDGRASREAILPAAIADGADVSAQLVGIARDQNRPLDTRRAALSWIARDDGTESASRVAQATDVLLRVAQDENETQALRRHALNVLGRVGRGAGVPALLRLANENTTSWTAEESVRALAQSGDPRARDFLRKAIQRTDLPDAMLVAVARGLGGSQATGQDIESLRNAFTTLPGERSRTAVMESIAQRGTASDTQWLLGIARDTKQPIETRRRALDLSARGTAGSTQVLGMYDSMDDPALKEALIRLYAQNNDRASVDKLISIARSDSNYMLRRRAIASLSRTQDPRAKQVLQEISTR